MKKNKKFNQNAAIRGVLRRLFARSPAVREALNRARREIPKYNKDGLRAKKDAVQEQCAVCKQWVGSTHVSVDHIEPVVDVSDGFVDWNIFIARLWCDSTNLQVICDTCHDKKTNLERITRLIGQYINRLKEIEVIINSSDINLWSSDIKLLKKELSKYIAKKKTNDFTEIVQRAQVLKNRLENRIKQGVKHVKT